MLLANDSGVYLFCYLYDIHSRQCHHHGKVQQVEEARRIKLPLIRLWQGFCTLIQVNLLFNYFHYQRGGFRLTPPNGGVFAENFLRMIL